MLTLTDPHEAYRRSSLDARVQGGDSAALVQLCLEQAVTALGSALYAQEKGDVALRSKALTRALTAITALEMGVDRDAPHHPSVAPGDRVRFGSHVYLVGAERFDREGDLDFGSQGKAASRMGGNRALF